MKIVVDAFGGDNAPNSNIDGSLMAIEKFKQKIVLVGDETKINNYLINKKYNKELIEIVHAPTVIENNESPTVAIKTKKDSSLVVGFDILKNDNECVGLVSAGSTGAVLTGGFLKLGRIKGVSRPALAPLLPTKTGGQVLLIDAGANVDAKPINICHFAVMGSIYFSEMFKVENPKVALLNVGTEDEKGNEFAKQTFPLLKKLPINFVGNMEARDFFSGKYDVVVTDGFSGNILLKASEGAINFAMSNVKKALTYNLISKIGAILTKPSLNKIKDKLDYTKYGGSPFIGCKKTIIKSHGSSKDYTICAAIEQVIKLEEKKINAKITEQMVKIEDIGVSVE